jgi:hypothetical protein
LFEPEEKVYFRLVRDSQRSCMPGLSEMHFDTGQQTP